jgi:GNAT superfamily N-acetyltransferase
LELRQTGEHTDIDALLEVFNSNPQWIAATDNFAGKTRYDRSDVEMFLWQGTMGEGSTCLEARVAGQDGPAGVVAWIAPHPRDQCPWIGCVVLHADHQRQGLGSEVLRAVEQLLAAAGWERVRASPPFAQPWAQAFLESLGYIPVEERLDQDKRRCMVMEKRLIAKPAVGPST